MSIGLIGFNRLMCQKCDKYRLHEAMMGLAKCVTCHWQRSAEEVVEPIQIEHFVG